MIRKAKRGRIGGQTSTARLIRSCSFVAILGLAVVATALAKAGPDDEIPVDLEFLYQSCVSKELSYAQGFCRGYVRGIWDTFRERCPPMMDEPTDEELAQIVTGYAAALSRSQRSPRVLGSLLLDHLPASVRTAFERAFNCGY